MSLRRGHQHKSLPGVDSHCQCNQGKLAGPMEAKRLPFWFPVTSSRSDSGDARSVPHFMGCGGSESEVSSRDVPSSPYTWQHRVCSFRNMEQGRSFVTVLPGFYLQLVDFVVLGLPEGGRCLWAGNPAPPSEHSLESTCIACIGVANNNTNFGLADFSQRSIHAAHHVLRREGCSLASIQSSWEALLDDLYYSYIVVALRHDCCTKVLR